MEGLIYRYNLAFAFDDQQNMDLPTATANPKAGTRPARGASRWRRSRRRPVALLHMPVVAGFRDQAVGVEPCHGASGQRHRRALLVEESRPVLHAGPVALDDRGIEAHVVDALLVREGLGDVVANGVPSAVGRAERGGAVHTVVGIQGDEDMLTALQTLPRDANLLAVEAGCEDYCEREVDEL